jgi:glycosyltransferase involved in cell wall biosynthesis
MKIYLISNMYPDERHPNYGVFVKNTEQILVDSGHEIFKTVLRKTTNKYKKLINYMMYYLKILIFGFFRKYDVIYVHYASHNSFPLLLLKKMKRNIKIVANVHGSDVVPEVASQEKYQPYVRKLLRASNIIITPSKYFKNLVSKKYGIPANNIQVFPSGGVNANIFFEIENKEKLLNDLSLNPSYEYIGFVGRIDVGKGWDIFLKAIKKMKDEGYFQNKKAIIVGNGKQKLLFENLIKEYDLSNDIIYYPLLPQAELRNIYNCLSVFCFPTTREGESLGLVGLEAMACGVPVIGSAIGGLLDYIEDGVNGYLFKTGDDNDLTDKLIKYFALSNQERDKMKQNAKITAKNFEVEHIKPKLIQIFSTLDKQEVQYEN